MSDTTIPWTDVTDNIIVVKGGGWWCRMISEGCVNCYAARLNQSSYFGGNHLPYTGHPPELILRTDLIDGWAKQRKPKRHFVASMTDIFGDWVTKEQVFKFLDGMLAAPMQTFQMLTKRSAIARELINEWVFKRCLRQLPEHMWIGASVESQKHDYRINELLGTKAAVRFLSLEPLLGPVDLGFFQCDCVSLSRGMHRTDCRASNRRRLSWIIAGGESGPKSRPCDMAWLRHILAQCQSATIPCFIKQVGRNVQWSTKDVEERWYEKFSHPKGGNMEEWPLDIRVRQFPRFRAQFPLTAPRLVVT